MWLISNTNFILIWTQLYSQSELKEYENITQILLKRGQHQLQRCVLNIYKWMTLQAFYTLFYKKMEWLNFVVDKMLLKLD